MNERESWPCGCLYGGTAHGAGWGDCGHLRRAQAALTSLAALEASERVQAILEDPSLLDYLPQVLRATVAAPAPGNAGEK